VSKKINDSAERFAKYVREECDPKKVTFWPWVDLWMAVYKTQCPMPRPSDAASDDMYRHLKVINNILGAKDWSIVVLCFEPFRNGKGNCKIKAGAEVAAELVHTQCPNRAGTQHTQVGCHHSGLSSRFRVAEGSLH